MKILYLTFDKPFGSVYLDRNVNVKSLSLKTFQIKWNTLTPSQTNSRYFLRMTGFSGTIISNNTNISGIPLLYDKGVLSSRWETSIEISLTSKVGDKIDFEIIDQDSNGLDFTGVSNVEIVFQINE